VPLRGLGLMALAAVTLAASACGSATDTPSAAVPTSAASERPALERTEINVGVLPIADVAPVYIALDRGLFAEAGLTVTTEVMQGGAAAIPAIQGGDLDIAYGAWPSFLIANQNGIPLRAIADGVSATEGFTEFLAAVGSDLEGRPEGLAGKTIALNTLGNIGELALRYTLHNAGLEYADVTAVEIPFPDMGAALDNGSVDVIWSVEPGVSSNKASLGAVTVVDSFVADMAGFPVAGYFVSADFAQHNPNTVAAFAAVVEAAATMANDDPKIVESIVQDYAGLPASLAAQVNYPEYHGTLDAATLERVYEFLQRFELIEPGLDVDALVGVSR
jgi:NitT/TauT family transport system substrate-binding protein